jgi:hypothetical protein
MPVSIPQHPHPLPDLAGLSEPASLAAAALAYAAVGVPVFPLRSSTKRPATPRGVLDATTDHDAVERWWRVTPTANIGLAMGWGLIAVDVDTHLGGLLDPTWTPTRAARTPKGGWHLYYRSPAQPIKNSVGRVAPGVDIRSRGGYVVAPPSLLATGGWEFANTLEVAELPTVILTAAQSPAGLAPRRTTHGRADHRPFRPVRRISEGGRNDYLARAAGWLLSSGEHDRLEELLKAHNRRVCVPPLPAAEVELIAKSISRYES